MMPASGLMQTLFCPTSMQGKNADGKKNQFLDDQQEDQPSMMGEDRVFPIFQSLQESVKKEKTEEPVNAIGIDFQVAEQKSNNFFTNWLDGPIEQLRMQNDFTQNAQGHPAFFEGKTSIQSQTAKLPVADHQTPMPTQASVQEKMAGAAKEPAVERSMDHHPAIQSPPAAPCGFREHHPEMMERSSPELTGLQKSSFDQGAETANTHEHENQNHHGKDGQKTVHDGKVDFNEEATNKKAADSILSFLDRPAKTADPSKTEKPFLSEPPSSTALVNEEPVKPVNFEAMRVNATVQDADKPVPGASPIPQTEKPSSGDPVIFERFSAPSENPPTNSLMDQLVDKAAIRSFKDRSELQIRLKPEFLGNVRMTISTLNEQVAVRIVTEHAIVKDTIESNLHQLKAELQHHGLTIDKFDVTVHLDADQQHGRDQFSQLFKDPSSPNGRQQPDGQDPAKEERQGDKHARDEKPQQDRQRRGQAQRDGVNHFA